MCRLIFLLFTLLHMRSASASLNHEGYTYQQPIKTTDEPPQLYDLSTKYGLSKIALPLVNNHLSNAAYIADGRLLKQYEVMESIPGDQIPDNFLSMSPLLLESFLAKYGRISPSLLPGRRLSPIIPPITPTNAAVALGSGGLGYTKLSNGGIYLGSGSIGYISGQERIRDIVEARSHTIAPAGPFSFGPSPSGY